jgi:hypothetical protein
MGSTGPPRTSIPPDAVEDRLVQLTDVESGKYGSNSTPPEVALNGTTYNDCFPVGSAAPVPPHGVTANNQVAGRVMWLVERFKLLPPPNKPMMRFKETPECAETNADPPPDQKLEAIVGLSRTFAGMEPYETRVSAQRPDPTASGLAVPLSTSTTRIFGADRLM